MAEHEDRVGQYRDVPSVTQPLVDGDECGGRVLGERRRVSPSSIGLEDDTQVAARALVGPDGLEVPHALSRQERSRPGQRLGLVVAADFEQPPFGFRRSLPEGGEADAVALIRPAQADGRDLARVVAHGTSFCLSWCVTAPRVNTWTV